MTRLSDTDRYTRHRALLSLAAMKPMVAAEHAGDIARALTDPSNAVIRLAERTLDRIFHTNSAHEVRMAAAMAVANMLTHPSSIMRETAVITLGKLSLTGALALYIGKLVETLDDPSHILSCQATIALRLQPPASIAPYAECIAKKLADSRTFVRRHAIQTLRHTEPKVLSTYAHLISQRLADDDETVREAAVDAIAGLKPAHKIAHYIEAIVRLLDDNQCVQIAASRLLCRLDQAAIAPYIGPIALKISHPSTKVRTTAIHIIGKQKPMIFAPHASVVSKILTGTYPNEEIHTARRAIKRFTTKLNKMFNDTDWYHRRNALDALRLAGYGGEMAVQKDSNLISLVQRTQEDESHQIQLCRLRRSYHSYHPLESHLAKWTSNAAKREYARVHITKT